MLYPAPGEGEEVRNVVSLLCCEHPKDPSPDHATLWCARCSKQASKPFRTPLPTGFGSPEKQLQPAGESQPMMYQGLFPYMNDIYRLQGYCAHNTLSW